MSKNQSVLLLISAVYSMAFAVFHIFFWRLFEWRKDLGRLTFINRSVMQILNLCLIFVFVLFACLAVAHREEMICTALGRSLLAGISLFWLLRMIEQVFFFGLKRPLSIFLTLVFLVGAILYALPLFLIGTLGTALP